MKALSDNLYFKNLDNNAGVFHTLIDAAEEEDIKEALPGGSRRERGGAPPPAHSRAIRSLRSAKNPAASRSPMKSALAGALRLPRATKPLMSIYCDYRSAA